MEKHKEAIISLTGDVSEMKKKINDILNRIDNLETKIEKMENEKIQEKAKAIFSCLDGMNNEDMYKMGKYILDLRKSKQSFNLDNIREGIDKLLSSQT